jgi:transcription elongation GreA/GreB family factor
MSETAAVEQTDSEEWFLRQLESEAIPVAELRRALSGLVARGATAQAEERARLLQDVLAERGRADDALAVLGDRAARLAGDDDDDAAAIRDDALAMFAGDRLRRDLVDHAGFGRGLPPAEAVRRLRVLLALREGGLCHDRTWGVGRIVRVDHFDRRVEIDFEHRRGHGMTFAYAGESLRPLADDDLLARWHRDRDGIARLVQERPDEIVRGALRSFGPLTAARLQDELVPRIVAEADWKRFWDAARRELRKDPCVVIPSKRTEPIVVRGAPADFGPAWFEALAGERDLSAVLSLIDELQASGRAHALDDASRAVLADRLGFVVKGAGARRPELTARAFVAADALGIGPEGGAIEALAAVYDDPVRLVDALRHSASRHARSLLDVLNRRGGEAFRARLRAALGALTIGPLADAIELLESAGEEAACADALREAIAAQRPSVEMLLWIHRHPDRIESWRLGRLPEITWLALLGMESDQSGEGLKAQNQLRERFARPEWLQTVMAAMSEIQRRDFVARLRETPAWPALERQAILGRLVKIAPDVEAWLRSAGADAPEAPARRRPQTSRRSYAERQAQLAKIVQEEIPKNSREIGHARGYGDLRENFEYKAAKEMQTILMRRQAELEQQLREVQPTDFEGVDASVAGPGTCVEVEPEGGPVERYCILGAWDRDEGHGIISCESRLAQAIEGRRAGDAVAWPHGETSVPARLRAVRPLPEEVRRWVRGER